VHGSDHKRSPVERLQPKNRPANVKDVSDTVQAQLKRFTDFDRRGHRARHFVQEPQFPGQPLAFNGAAAPLERTLDGPKQLRRVERLRHKRKDVLCVTFKRARQASIRGDDNGFGCCVVLPERFDDIKSRASAKAQIDDHDTEATRREGGKGIVAGLRADDVEPACLADMRQHPQHKGVVVDDKHSFGCHIHEIDPGSEGAAELKYDEMAIHETRIARMCAVSAVLTAIMMGAGCAPSRAKMPGTIDTPAASALKVRVAGRIMSVPLERYVLGAALSEVTPTGEKPAAVTRVYEVQSVIARTYALTHRRRHAAEGFDLCDTTHCQLYQPDRIRTSSFSASAEEAVTRTRGQVLRIGGATIDALFHADCGGHTTTPAAAWRGTNFAYLPAREDVVSGLTHRTWTFEASDADWRTLLNGDSRTSVGAVFRSMEIAATGPGERVTSIRLFGERERVVSGDVIRTVVTAARGVRALMSTRFTVHRTPTGIRLVGSGFGHGVGLCQVGAIARARRGDSVADILEHYFPGTRLSRS
jgi:SpoIID/LytB domain protein